MCYVVDLHMWHSPEYLHDKDETGSAGEWNTIQSILGYFGM